MGQMFANGGRLAAVAVLLAGCSSLLPTASRPPAATPTQRRVQLVAARYDWKFTPLRTPPHSQGNETLVLGLARQYSGTRRRLVHAAIAYGHLVIYLPPTPHQSGHLLLRVARAWVVAGTLRQSAPTRCAMAELMAFNADSDGEVFAGGGPCKR